MFYYHHRYQINVAAPIKPICSSYPAVLEILLYRAYRPFYRCLQWCNMHPCNQQRHAEGRLACWIIICPYNEQYHKTTTRSPHNCLAKRPTMGTASESHVKSHLQLMNPTRYDMAADLGSTAVGVGGYRAYAVADRAGNPAPVIYLNIAEESASKCPFISPIPANNS